MKLNFIYNLYAPLIYITAAITNMTMALDCIKDNDRSSILWGIAAIWLIIYAIWSQWDFYAESTLYGKKFYPVNSDIWPLLYPAFISFDNDEKMMQFLANGGICTAKITVPILVYIRKRRLQIIPLEMPPVGKDWIEVDSKENSQ